MCQFIDPPAFLYFFACASANAESNRRPAEANPILVLVNENGSPLRQRGFRADGKIHNLDNIKKAYERACTKLGVEVKPLKLFRKTGASKLEEHETYGRYAQFYLGHAPQSVAESRYARPSDEQFDRALKWLGEQFDIK